jgi:hypothetical protein
MKHLATIQTEFLKTASLLKESRKWDDLTFEDQRAYLKRHPASKRRVTSQTSERDRKGELKYFGKETEILADGTGISAKRRLKNKEQSKSHSNQYASFASYRRQVLRIDFKSGLKELSKLKNLRSAPEASKRKTIVNGLIDIIKENDKLGGRPMISVELKKNV